MLFALVGLTEIIPLLVFAGMVLAMGIISLVGVAVVGGLPIIFGIIGWVMGQTDLRKMRNNQMDRDGEGMTRAGWICSIFGTLVNGAIFRSRVSFKKPSPLPRKLINTSQNSPARPRCISRIRIEVVVAPEWR